MQEVAVLLYPRRDGVSRAKVPVLRGLVIESPDRELAQHLASCAIARSRPESVAVFIDVSPEVAAEPNSLLDMAGIFADDPTLEPMLEEIYAARDRDDEAWAFPGLSPERASVGEEQREVKPMQFTIILRPQEDGTVEATVPAIPGLAVSGRDRDRALDLARCAIIEAIDNGEVVVIDVPSPVETTKNPWVATAGMFADDPTLEPMLKEIYAARDAERPSD